MNGQTWLRGGACALGLAALAGCSSVPQQDFSSWAVTYNETVEQAQNRTILLNILRASRNMPLYFSGTQVVRGSGTTNVSGGIGGSISNTTASQPFGSSSLSLTSGLTPSLNVSVDRNFNFDVAIADTAEFQQALLMPMKEDVMHYYTQQGLPPEMLLHLLVQKFRITVDGTPEVYENNPMSPTYPEFVATVEKLLDYGLTTQVNDDFSPVGPVYRQPDLRGIAEIVKAGGFILPAQGGFQVAIRQPVATFCFDPSVPGNVQRLPATVMCRRPDLVNEMQPLARRRVEFENASLYVQLRSTREVFDYLGTLLVQAEADPRAQPLRLTSKAALAYLKNHNCTSAGSQCGELFRLHRNTAAKDAVTINFGGTAYSLTPSDGSLSSTVLSVLVQTLNLNKSVNSLPLISTTVVR